MATRGNHNLDLHTTTSTNNPYRDLVEKYEALLEVQRSSLARKTSNNNNQAGVSLAEEFQNTSANCSNNTDAGSSCNGSISNETSMKIKSTVTIANNNQNEHNAKNSTVRGRTPCEFSEAETSSSGFSDETSNKGTQTDERPGYFLCSIGDGENCKFSIYDDVSPLDSRFRNRPEYRELFKEIFAVLKRAAENKEEGDKLPLLDDTHPVTVPAAKVPPVTPANEELPVDFGDDAQSIVSSVMSEQSFAMSECITKLERKTAKKHIIEKTMENKSAAVDPNSSYGQLATSGENSQTIKPIIENGRVMTPLKREPLEYLTVGVGIKKKGRNRKNRNFSNDRSESPVALPSPPRFYVGSGKKRRPLNMNQGSPHGTKTSPAPSGTQTPTRVGTKFEWNGSSMVIYNRANNRNREFELGGFEYRPSTVSQDLHKLKKLDLSYAEVLRRADACTHHHQQHNQHKPSQQNRRRNNTRN